MKLLTTFFLTLATLLLPVSLAYADDDFYGTLEERPQGQVGTWVIGGQSFEINQGTQLEEDDGLLEVGACVEVNLEGNFVEEIETEDPSKCQR